jgi:hypothetical protein
MIIRFSVIFIIFFCFYTKANNFKDVENDGKAFGKQILDKNKNNTYRAEDVPGFTTSNPKEASYYGNVNALESAGSEEFNKDDNTKMVLEQYDKKLQVDAEAEKLANQVNNNTQVEFYSKDGKCGEEYKNETADPEKMKESITFLTMMQEIEKDSQKDKKNIRIFRGELKKCTRDTAGYNNCCKASGWGQGIGAKCNAEEQNLGLQREKRQCIYYRTYCSKELDLLVGTKCLVYTEEYCCFGSNLNKIIADNGRRQLGIPLGPQKIPTGETNCKPFWGCRPVYKTEPACRGFTPDELSRIKMDKIDFKEFTNTLNPQMNNINKDKIQNQINQIIGKSYEK